MFTPMLPNLRRREWTFALPLLDPYESTDLPVV